MEKTHAYTWLKLLLPCCGGLWRHDMNSGQQGLLQPGVHQKESMGIKGISLLTELEALWSY